MNRAWGICTALGALLWAGLAGADPYAQDAGQAPGELLRPTGAVVGDEVADVDEEALGQVIADLRADERALRQTIAALEASEGAYAPGLTQPLLSLGLALQTQDRHAEAVELFRRGAHLARISDGLYSPQQLPLIEGEIASALAQGQYAAVDERQSYLYRVQIRCFSPGPERARALIQQADWQRRAYQLELDKQGFRRLMNMWELYRVALNDIVAREGETSPALLQPLRGMLQTQYLISTYEPDSNSGTGFATQDNVALRQQLGRFYSYRSQSYDKGRAVILAIYDIEHEHPEVATDSNALVMLGDWHLWHDKRDAAWQAYRDAAAQLAGRADAATAAQRLLDAPAALPDIDGIRPLPPPVPEQQGNVLLAFGVNERGRVVDLERLDDDDASDGGANRLMRQLRRTKFRPRFAAGEPIQTRGMVRAYDIR
ncbi:MAG: hypothetical protein KDI01_06900 [Halioglobus sp.]|nr:hypothetical protein [Halioglobus sp.]